LGSIHRQGTMRIGVLTRGTVEELDWARRLGFRSTEWIQFHESPAAPANADWKPLAEQVAAEARVRDIRISAIGALYANPLDPRQTEPARAVFTRAIEVARHIGVKTVCGFAGARIETEVTERGGNPVYKPLENYLPQVLEFWEPLARFAADHGVRLAFEHCPQGPYHQPVMHYNIFGQVAMWERLFNATRCENLGLEWDPSHLICQLVDPVTNLRRFGSRVFHVHAKDASIDRRLLEEFGLCHWGVAEHRFPGLGQANWAEIVRALVAAGYDSDLNIEGFHDPVFRDHEPNGSSPLAGRKLEDAGLVTSRRFLDPLIAGLAD
jgi:sugar phosphate isomerase/epimerase